MIYFLGIIAGILAIVGFLMILNGMMIKKMKYTIGGLLLFLISPSPVLIMLHNSVDKTNTYRIEEYKNDSVIFVKNNKSDTIHVLDISDKLK